MWVKEYMCDWVDTISEDKTIKEAVEQMVENKTNSLIVVDEEYKPIGLVSSRSLIRAVVPAYLKDDPSYSKYGAEGTFDRYANASKDIKVKEVMFSEFHNLTEDDTMIEAAAYASESSRRAIPVVNSEEKLIGVITRTCIKLALYNSIFKNKKVDPKEMNRSREKANKKNTN